MTIKTESKARKHLNISKGWVVVVLAIVGAILALFTILLTNNANAAPQQVSIPVVSTTDTDTEYLTLSTSMTAQRNNFETEHMDPVKVDFEIKVNKETTDIEVVFKDSTTDSKYVLNDEFYEDYVYYAPMGGYITYHMNDGSLIEDMLFYNYQDDIMVYFGGESRAWDMEKVDKISIPEPWGNPYDMLDPKNQ